ncbi:DUF488 domain-containing protein [Peribacillus cavernae]|uniref:DUF488 domain-containing protein n=1 Tax=Peribacillus cavernae TaxID=1674310 RepID=A0A3S0VEH3_9BACI|nr:DUF488 domain-containing protein [Peribacillus cavernae]MDQ0219749.1 uncharacterized protein (DUF488 family) [Peribacillus cavernae]RUQ25167.1 DUF488 domain-containing protein [Peribacillus cavernae]
MEIYTIGHSTHFQETFIDMLKYCGIELLADVRAFPGSRKFPQFSKDTMSKWLENETIQYHHFVELGGRRRKSKKVDNELNGAWKNQSFHNYADYTLSCSFDEGIDQLMEKASSKLTAYCCSERHPARCHRLLISNWLVANGWTVKHIIDGREGEIDIVEHELGKWGASPVVQENGTVIYPA